MTEDRFTTLTDIVFQSYGVTGTQFVVRTATRPLQQVRYTYTYDVVSDIQSILLTLLNMSPLPTGCGHSRGWPGGHQHHCGPPSRVHHTQGNQVWLSPGRQNVSHARHHHPHLLRYQPRALHHHCHRTVRCFINVLLLNQGNFNLRFFLEIFNQFSIFLILILLFQCPADFVYSANGDQHTAADGDWLPHAVQHCLRPWILDVDN